MCRRNKITFKVEEMVFIQECGMRKSPCRANIAGKLIAHVWSTETVPKRRITKMEKYCDFFFSDSPDTSKFATGFPKLFFDRSYPFRHYFIGGRNVFCFPSLEIEIRICRLVVFIFPMLLNWILE